MYWRGLGTRLQREVRFGLDIESGSVSGPVLFDRIGKVPYYVVIARSSDRDRTEAIP